MSNLVGVRNDNAGTTLLNTEALNPFLLSRRDRLDLFAATSVTADALLAASREVERQRRLRTECRPDLRLYHLAVNAYVDIVNADTGERLYMTPVVMGSTMPIWKAKYRIEPTTPRLRFDIRHWIDATHSWAIGCSSVHLGSVVPLLGARDVVDHKMPVHLATDAGTAPAGFLRIRVRRVPITVDAPKVGVHTRHHPYDSTCSNTSTFSDVPAVTDAPFATVALDPRHPDDWYQSSAVYEGINTAPQLSRTRTPMVTPTPCRWGYCPHGHLLLPSSTGEHPVVRIYRHQHWRVCAMDEWRTRVGYLYGIPEDAEERAGYYDPVWETKPRIADPPGASAGTAGLAAAIAEGAAEEGAEEGDAASVASSDATGISGSSDVPVLKRYLIWLGKTVWAFDSKCCAQHALARPDTSPNTALNARGCPMVLEGGSLYLFEQLNMAKERPISIAAVTDPFQFTVRSTYDNEAGQMIYLPRRVDAEKTDGKLTLGTVTTGEVVTEVCRVGRFQKGFLYDAANAHAVLAAPAATCSLTTSDDQSSDLRALVAARAADPEGTWYEVEVLGAGTLSQPTYDYQTSILNSLLSERQAFMTFVATALQQAKEFFKVVEQRPCD
jgi:hypothetical protein